MSIKKRLLSAALALALGASLLTGCSKGADGSGSQSGSGDSSSDVQAMDLTDVTDPYLATAGIAGDTVVGTVGDYEVTADSLLYWLNYNINYTKQQYSAYGISDMRWDETSEDGTTTAQALLKTAMQLASFYRLLPELAAKEGLSVSQETIDGLKDDEASITQQLGSETLKDHYFWMQMLTPALYQKMYQAGEASQLLQDEYFGEGTQGYPTDAEVKTYAEDELGYYRAKHILLLTKDMTQTVTNDDGTTRTETVEVQGVYVIYGEQIRFREVQLARAGVVQPLFHIHAEVERFGFFARAWSRIDGPVDRQHPRRTRHLVFQRIHRLYHPVRPPLVVHDFERVVVGIGRPHFTQRCQRERRRVIRRRNRQRRSPDLHCLEQLTCLRNRVRLCW